MNFNNKYAEEAYHVKVEGLVQGVGFRPFVYRLAYDCGLFGRVKNTNESVYIFIQGPSSSLEKFIHQLPLKKPDAAVIQNISYVLAEPENICDFEILESENVSDDVTLVSPDIAVCKECLNDMHNQHHRIGYPLINCTLCGPRFSIVKELPYDRLNTTMQAFEMCPVCKKEYETITDRRFHAQPVACNNCGPVYTLHQPDKTITSLPDIFKQISLVIENGNVFALKGTGGFHLVCDATNEFAVKKLREIKLRDHKPFAVMFRDIKTLKKYTLVNETEEAELTSFRKPIVILEQKEELAHSVSAGLTSIGSMLHYMPFHYLMFKHIKTDALVMTSGNITDEPIIIDNQKALNTFLPLTGCVVTYNRDIHNRVDDSVVHVINDKPRIIRRSRGYVPSPVYVKHNVEGIFAAGAELTGTFAIGKRDKIFLSQYLGDLQGFGNYLFFQESYERFKKLFRFEPTLIAADLHPDYLSTRFAHEMNITLTQVQHHHAHIASCMAEHQLDEKVIGVAFDGTGLGDDNNIWGGEFLISDLTSYKRAAHFDYIPLPGGDKVSHEPWRTGLSLLHKVYGKELFNQNIPFVNKIEQYKAELIIQSLEQKINCPLSSSAGRLFDAVSAITDLCNYATFHAEAPMKLESMIDKNSTSFYPFHYSNGVVQFETTIDAILNDIKRNVPISIISTQFHNTIVEVITEVCTRLSNETGIKKVVLSGGSFQNKYLVTLSENKLNQSGFSVFMNQHIPANDSGIALGQTIIAAKRRLERCV
jgi:hydrogenase maturation protein HypF